MAIESAPFYWIVCDIDGCEARCPDAGTDDCVAWADQSQAEDCALSSDWMRSQTGLWACEEHAFRWCERCGVDAGQLAGERDYLCADCAGAPS